MTLTNGKNVTWQWLVGILMILLFAAGGVLLADNKAKVQKTKPELNRCKRIRSIKNSIVLT